MATRKPRRFRPSFEALEDRQLLSVTISGVVTEYPVPTNGRPAYITPGPAGDNELWFTDGYNNRIGRVNSAGIFDTFYQVPTQEAQLGDLTAGPDGNVWFLENLVDQIGRVTADGVITEFPLGRQSVTLTHIVAGPDGNLWFTEGSANVASVVGRITPDGQVSQFQLPGDSSFHTPSGIAAGPDGALWLTEPYSGEIVRLSTTGQVHEFTTGIAQGAFPLNITTGSDGNLWFTEPGINKVGRITPAGVVTEFGVNIRPNSGLDAITAGPDGALWFMEDGNHIANQVGRITTDGSVSEYAIPTYDHSGQSITAGTDGNIWFTESNPGKIGMVDLSAALPHVGFSATSYTAADNAGSIAITVQRSGDTTAAVGVHYATSNGSAHAGVDYTAVAGDLTFAPGQTTKTFTISIQNDGQADGSETVNLTLSSPTGGAALGTAATAVLTLHDPQPGQLAFSAPAYTFTESGGAAVITVSRTGGNDGTVTVQYATANGSAAAGVDYLATAGTLTFNPGETSKSFVVPLRDRGLTQGSASLSVTLSAASGGAALGTPAEAVVTILENDAPPPPPPGPGPTPEPGPTPGPGPGATPGKPGKGRHHPGRHHGLPRHRHHR
jgi:streptogramin lyase